MGCQVRTARCAHHMIPTQPHHAHVSSRRSAPGQGATHVAPAPAPKPKPSSKREAAAELMPGTDKKQRGAKLRAIVGIAQEAPTLEDPPEKEDRKDADYDVKNEDRRGLR